MSTIRLNHQAVQKYMAENLLRPKDLADKLGISPQLANFVLHRGGRKYAERLAIILNCRLSDILITWQPVLKAKSHKIVNNKLRKKGE